LGILPHSSPQHYAAAQQMVFKVTAWRNAFQWKTLTVNLQAIQTFYDLAYVIENVFNARGQHITEDMRLSLFDAVEQLEEDFEDIPWLLMDATHRAPVHIIVNKSVWDFDDYDSDDDYIIDETPQFNTLYEYFPLKPAEDPMIC
jgi:hypothetical protein